LERLETLQAAQGHFGKLQAPNLLATQHALFVHVTLQPLSINREHARKFVPSAQKLHLVFAVKKEPQAEAVCRTRRKRWRQTMRKVRSLGLHSWSLWGSPRRFMRS